MNGYQPITILRILLCLTLGLWLSNTPLPIALADPPVPSPFPTVAPSPFPTAAPPVPPAANPMPIDFTYGPKAGILIHVLLNGKTPATFILDSGFSASCITEEMVKKLGITPKPALGPDGKPIDTIVKNALGVFPSMQIGSISYASIGLVVVTEDQMHLNAITGQPVDGVIGNNILGFLPCFVDFAKNQVTFLYHLPVTTELLQRLGMQDASVCPLTTIMDGSLYVTGVHMVNGSQSDDENLAVDLGSDLSVLPEQAAKKLGLATISQSHYHTPYGNFSLEACLLSSLSFPASGLTVKNQSVSYEKGNLPNGVSGLLGRDVLSQFQVLLDFAAKKMYLKPIAASARSQTTSPQTIIASSAPAMPTSLVSEPTDQPLLQVSFEGKTTGTFLLATLSPLSSLSSDFAAKLGLTPQPAVMGDGKPHRQ